MAQPKTRRVQTSREPKRGHALLFTPSDALADVAPRSFFQRLASFGCPQIPSLPFAVTRRHQNVA